MNTTSTSDIRELDRRSSDGLEITLLWHAPTNRVLVAVTDERHDVSIEIEIDPSHARDAFLHPFAYAQAADEYALAA